MKVERKVPSVREYNYLRERVGWGTIEEDMVEQALSNSIMSLCVYENGEIAAHVRIIGDGAVYFYVQDMIVLPERQGLGIGTLLMNEVMNWFHTERLGKGFLMLMSADGKSAFYEKFGFQRRPEEGPGMQLRR